MSCTANHFCVQPPILCTANHFRLQPPTLRTANHLCPVSNLMYCQCNHFCVQSSNLVYWQSFLCTVSNLVYCQSFLCTVSNLVYCQSFLSTASNLMYCQSFMCTSSNLMYWQSFLCTASDLVYCQNHFTWLWHPSDAIKQVTTCCRVPPAYLPNVTKLTFPGMPKDKQQSTWTSKFLLCKQLAVGDVSASSPLSQQPLQKSPPASSGLEELRWPEPGASYWVQFCE